MLTKDEYIAKKQKQLDDWSENIRAVEAKSLKSKTKQAEKLIALHAFQVDGIKHLELIKAASEETWEKVRAESQNVWVALKDSLRQFKTHFK